MLHSVGDIYIKPSCFIVEIAQHDLALCIEHDTFDLEVNVPFNDLGSLRYNSNLRLVVACYGATLAFPMTNPR